MTYPSSKLQQVAKQLGVSVQVLEQYLQLKQVEVMPEVAARQPLKGQRAPVMAQAPKQ